MVNYFIKNSLHEKQNKKQNNVGLQLFECGSGYLMFVLPSLYKLCSCYFGWYILCGFKPQMYSYGCLNTVNISFPFNPAAPIYMEVKATLCSSIYIKVVKS